jgi:predicted PurR-regulated permease PerM
LILATLSGFLEIVPLVGPLIAATLAGTVAFSTRGMDTTIAVLAVYIVVRQVEDQVVMPLVIGRAVHLHPVVTIFAVLVGLSAWGVLGGLLAVPVAAALNVTLHELFPEETSTERSAPDRERGEPMGGSAEPMGGSAEPIASSSEPEMAPPSSPASAS